MPEEFLPVSAIEERNLLQSGVDPTAVQTLVQDRASLVKEQEDEKLAEWRKQLDAQSTQGTVEEFNNEAVQLKISDEYANAPQVDPLTAWDVDTLAKNKQFSIEQYVAQHPESVHDERADKLSQIWKERHKEPIKATDVAIGVAKLPWTTAKHLYKFGKGTGTTIYDSLVAPLGVAAASAAGDITGQGPEFDKAILERQAEIDKNLASDLVGLEQGTFNFASWISNIGTTLPRRFANTKVGGAFGFDTWDDVPDDQLKREFQNSMENYLQGLRVGKGEGEFSQAVGGEFIKEAEAEGGLDEERIASMAEADPVGFFMFGQAFRAAHVPIQAAKAPLKQAEQLTRMRQIKQALPPGDPQRQMAELLVKTMEKDATMGARMLDRVSKVTVAADDLMKARLRVRMADDALKKFGATAERQTSVDRAKAALQQVEEATQGQFSAQALAKIRGAANSISGVDLGVKAVSAVPTAAGQVARAGAKAIETLPTTAGVAGGLGLLLTGSPLSGLALMFGARKIPGAQAAATTAAKPLRAAQEGLGHVGRVLRSPEAATPYQKALKGITRGSVETVVEGLKGVPVDVGFALALAESPESVQNMSGYAAAFRSLHAAGRPLSRFVQAVKTGPQAVQATGIPRQAGNVRSAAALTEAWRRNLPPEQQKWLAATETWLRDIGSEAPVYGMTTGQFKKFLTDQFTKREGRPPTSEEAAEIDAYSQSRGSFMEEVIGDNGERGSAMVVTDASAVPHEGMHAFQEVLGKNGNKFVDQLIMEEFAGEWDSFAQNYAARLTGKPSPNWRGEIQKLIPTEIREEAGGDPNIAADIFIAREYGAETFAELFKATGGRPQGPSTLVEKLATVIDRTAKFFGTDLLAAARSEGLGARVSGRVLDAVRSQVQKQATDVAGQRAEGTLPAAEPSGRAVVREPVPGERPVPERPANLREPPITDAAMDEFQARTPERLNIALARELSSKMPAEQQLVVDVISQALQRKPGEAVVLELENLSVIPEHQQKSLNREVRRAEQALPDAMRDFFSKRIAVTRFLSDQFSGGKLQLAAMSMDKVLANVFQLQERLHKAGATELSPYEVDARTGQMTENGWRSFSEDLKAYTANQANGYRGGGKEIIRPDEVANDLRIAIPEQTPNYRPTALPERVEQYINTIMGLKLPKTPRETKGVPPGNLKGQVLREAQGERVLEPADIQRRGKTFKRDPSRTIQEVNPLRQEMNQRGVDTTKLLDVTERLNVDRLRNVTPRFDLQFNLPSTDVVRAGFLPAAEAVAPVAAGRAFGERSEPRTALGREVLGREDISINFKARAGDAVGDRLWELSAFDSAGNRVGRVLIGETGTPGEATVGGFDVTKSLRGRQVGEALFREAGDRVQAEGIETLHGDIVSPQAIRSRERILPETEFSDVLGGRISGREAAKALREGELAIEARSDIRGKQFLPSEREIEIANRTARAAGSVGSRLTRTAKAVLERVEPTESVLDFGAGDKARQSENLREQGFTDITSHEFGANVREGVHDPRALDREYDAVFASNVLNVQSSRSMLESTLADISRSVKPEGRALFNFPKSPRKMEITPDQMAGEILKQFGQIERVGGTKSEPVWEARNPKPVPSREEIAKGVEDINRHRFEGTRGFTDPAKFGAPEELKRQDRERATGQKEFQFLPKAVEDVAAMTPLEFANRAREMKGGLTGEAIRLGKEISEAGDVNKLDKFAAEASNESKQLMADGNFDAAMAAATKAQFFREAKESATGTGSVKSFEERFTKPTEGPQEAAETPRAPLPSERVTAKENADLKAYPDGSTAPPTKSSYNEKMVKADSAIRPDEAPNNSKLQSISPAQFSPGNLTKWGRELRDFLKKRGVPPEEIDRRVAETQGQIDLVASLFQHEAASALLPESGGVARTSVSTPEGLKLGLKPSELGPMRTNMDPLYVISLDLTAECVRRFDQRATQLEIMRELNRPLTDEETMNIVLEMRDQGKTAPCLFCYVEPPRRKMSDLLTKWKDIFNGKKAPADKHIETVEEFKKLGITGDNIDWTHHLDPTQSGQQPAYNPEVKVGGKTIKLHNFLKTQTRAMVKNPDKYEAYDGQVLKIADEMRDYLNARAGLRFFSNSDFQPEHAVDMMQAVSDASVKAQKMHGYTKQPGFVQIFGRTGAKINQSVFLKTATDFASRDLTHQEAKGFYDDIQYDRWQSFPWEEAIANRKFEDVGNILVATDDVQIWWALDSKHVDQIIPYHASGLPVRYSAPLAWKDYTNQQHEHWKPGRGPVIPKGSTPKEKTAIIDKFRESLPEHLRQSVNGKGEPVIRQNQFLNLEKGTSNAQAKKRYLELVEELGAEPVFPQFLEHPNYIKLRKDFARTDTPFRVPEPKFDIKAASDITREWIEKGGDEPKPDMKIVEKLVPQYRDNQSKSWASERLAKEAPKAAPEGVGTPVKVGSLGAPVSPKAAQLTPDQIKLIKPPTGPGQKSVEKQIEDLDIKPRS